MGGDPGDVPAARAAAEAAHRAVRSGEQRGPGNPSAAEDVAQMARRSEPLLDMKQRTTHEDPNFMETFFRASRLHYIGTWKHRYEAFLEDLPPAPKLPAPEGGPGGERVILHVDMDCFFASVAALGRPELAGLPVAVSWSSAGGGELSSCNYLARNAGCRAGMRIARAKELCPNLIVMPYEFERYSAVAIDVYRTLHELSPHVMGVSVDEAYVDVTGLAACGRKTPREIAEDVRAKIFEKTGCVASVGSGPNRLIARLATKRAKPDGSHHVPASNASSFLASMPVAELPGVGRGTLEKLRREGIGSTVDGVGPNTADPTCADVAAAPLSVLRRALGPKAGAQLRDASRGIDAREWEARPPRKSVGAQVTWGVRFAEAAEAVAFVEKLCGEVSERMRRLKVKGRTLTLKILRAVANAPANYMKGSIGHGVCDHLTRSSTVSLSVDDAPSLAREAVRLLADLNVPADQIRGAGVQVTRLDSDPASHGGGGAGGAFRAFKSAPAGPRSDWTDRASRFAGWYDVKPSKPTGGEDDDDGSGKIDSPCGKDSPGRKEPGAMNAYASALGARGGSLERALSRVAAVREETGGSEMRERGGSGGTEAPAGAEEEEEEEENGDGEGEDAAVMESLGDESLAAAYESAARTFAWERIKRRRRTDDTAGVDGNAETKVEEEEKEEDESDEARDARATALLRGAESFLLELAGARLRLGGESSAAATLAQARRLATSQECVPSWVHALTGGGERSLALARCWRGACDRVEDEMISIVHSQ